MQTQQRLIKHYNDKYKSEISKKADGICELKKFPQTRIESCLKYFVNTFKGGDILELGAGDGTLARSFAGVNINFDSYTISDFSDSRVEGMKKSITNTKINVIQINCENIPVETLPKYDAVIMVALIEHLTDPLGAMQKIRRMLKPGGFVYIDTPNMAIYHRRLKLLRGIFPSTASKNEGLTTYDNEPVDLYDEGHLHYFTYSALSKMLFERCGFDIVKTAGYSTKNIFGKVITHYLAAKWPKMFSELALIASVK
ncbi:MAG: class I SAM-dependent methyltransferase [Ignavibacteria bacterium]